MTSTDGKKLDRWIPLAEAAELAHVNVDTMRRRMHALNERMGGRVMVSYHRRGKPRKYFVSVEALFSVMHTDPELRDRELAEMSERLRSAELKLDALRNWRRVQVAKQASLEALRAEVAELRGFFAAHPPKLPSEPPPAP